MFNEFFNGKGHDQTNRSHPNVSLLKIHQETYFINGSPLPNNKFVPKEKKRKQPTNIASPRHFDGNKCFSMLAYVQGISVCVFVEAIRILKKIQVMQNLGISSFAK